MLLVVFFSSDLESAADCEVAEEELIAQDTSRRNTVARVSSIKEGR